MFTSLPVIVENFPGGREDNAGFPRLSPPSSLHGTRFEALLQAVDRGGPGQGRYLRSDADLLLQAGTDEQHEPTGRKTSGPR